MPPRPAQFRVPDSGKSITEHGIAAWLSLTANQRRRVTGGFVVFLLTLFTLPPLVVWMHSKEKISADAPAGTGDPGVQAGHTKRAGEYREPRVVETAPRRQAPQYDPGTELLQSLAAEAARQERERKRGEYERFKNAIERSRVCGQCGGAGNYRYVDGAGNLVVKQCPSCRGSGTNW